MTARRVNPGRTRRWTLLALCGAAFLLLSWHLLYMMNGLAAKSRKAAARVTRDGREMLGSARYSGFSSPSAGQALLLDAARSRGAEPELRKVGVMLGRQEIWAVPKGPLPAVQAPPANQDRTYAGEGARWIYAKTLRDGRTVLLVFDLKAFHTAWVRLLALAGLEAVLLLFLLLTMGFQGWRLMSERSRLSDDLAFLREDAPASVGPPGMVRMLQRTLEELRKRTRELEELHQLQKNRAESVEAMVQALCSNLEAGYLRFDEQVKLSGMNAPGRLLLGLPTVPRLGDGAPEVLGAFPELVRLLDESRETRSVVTREEIPGAEGRLLQAVAIPLFSLANQLQGQLLMLRDMTRLYQMGRTLREQESLSRLGQVAAGVAHEMRNGLNVLSGQLRLLEKDHPELDAETRIGELKEEIGRMEQVVRNLLDYSRPLKLEREELDAEPLLNSVSGAFEDVTGDVSIELDLPGGGIRFRGDRESLHRALLNLVRNAAEAVTSAPGGAKGRIRLAVGQDAHFTTFFVEDDGPGFPGGDPESLFVPFQTHKAGGTGLGLPIARKIAREHGGDLEARSSGDLGGALFILTIPTE